MRVYPFLSKEKKKGQTTMKQILTIQHRVDDYVCMWNGIEDLYIRDTQETLPPKFFFSLASFGSFCYMKTNSSELKRMVALGDGRVIVNLN